MMYFDSNKLKSASAIWQSAVKRRSRLRDLLKRSVPLIVGGNTLGWIKAVSHFTRFVFKLYRHSGSRGLAIYLKACNLMLIRMTAGRKLEHSRLAGTAVSATNSGIPRCIVPSHRLRIKYGDKGCLRLYLGFFTLYRALDFRGKLTIKSITDPGVEIPEDLWFSYRSFVRTFRKLLEDKGVKPCRVEWSLYDYPHFRSKGQEYRSFPDLAASRLVLHSSGPESKVTASSSVISHGRDVWNWVHSSLYCYLHGMVMMTNSTNLLNSTVFRLAKEWAPSKVAWLRNENPDENLGRLSIREEPGKLRIFAMVDSLTQWLLYPLHKYLFSVLSKIPQDGTFNQTKPVEDLLKRMEDKGLKQMWSYDLSAATDRIPVVLQEVLLGVFTSFDFAYTWKHFLCDRLYRLPPLWIKTHGVKAGRAVRYAVGQPMGAYSSWAMLALVHHCIVQFAASRVGIRGWFTDYAVLGDDIVIAHREVAREYVFLMGQFGVGIGFHKSVISNNRSCEFAKRYYYKGEEVSPLPLVGIGVGFLGVSMIPEIVSASYSKTGKLLSNFLIGKFIGVGYKACSGADNKAFRALPRKLRSVLLLMMRPGSVKPVTSLFDWVKAVSFGKKSSPGPKEVNVYSKYLVSHSRKRLEVLMTRLEHNLSKFAPVQTWEPNEMYFKEYLKWFKLYIIEPLQQDFYVQRITIEGKIRRIHPLRLPTDREVSELLGALDELERDIGAIPVMVYRHSSQRKLKTGIPLIPSLVRSWLTAKGMLGSVVTNLVTLDHGEPFAISESPLDRLK